MRRRLWLTLFIVCWLFGLVYSIAAWQNAPASVRGWALLYDIAAVGGFMALGLAINGYFKPKRIAPGRTFWTTFLLSLLFIVVGRIIGSLGHTEPFVVGLDSVGWSTDELVTIYDVLKNNILSLIEVSFALLLLLRLRDLVLYKRTRSSLRNWRLMLVLIAVAALSTFGLGPASADSFLLQQLMIVPAVVFMIVNAFRLSWIAFLSFREKMASIGLSVLLLIILAVGFGTGTADVYDYLGHYSYPLRLFVVLCMTFGIIYSLTAFLSLLFHLPTTSDFQQKAGEIAAMHTLTHLSSDVFDRSRLAERIAASAVDAGTARSAWLAAAESSSGSMRPQVLATHGQLSAEQIEKCINLSDFYEELVRTGEPILLDEATVDHRVHVQPGGAINSLLVLPLRARDHMLGALFVAKEVSYGFERDDVEAVSVFAAQAALAFDNAQLFEEQLEKERLAREMAIARDVQQRLLPDVLPEMKGISISASSVSALEVGGDFYDFMELEDGRLAVIIADVSGKGNSAAFYMAELQGIFRALSPLTPSPVDFLCHANRALATALERHVFVSVVYGVLDPQEGTFMIARAGHCPVAAVRDDGATRLLRPSGLGLGLDTGPLFRRSLEVERVQMEPEEVFVLYTDGVVESRNASNEQYGYDRLLSSLRSHREKDSDALHGALISDLRTFLGTDTYDDDMTLAVLKWHGVTEDEPTLISQPATAGSQ